MSQKIDGYYRNRARIGLAVIAAAFFGVSHVAQAEVEGTTPFARTETEIKKTPSEIRDGILTGRSAYRNHDYNTALREFMPLAKEGNTHAQYYLGLMYANGYGVPQDLDKAEKWFKKFSERMGSAAKFNLGVMYFQGKLVPQNYRQAVAWFERAAEEGDAKAQFNLGYIYDNGYGVPQDLEEAVWWYQKAARQGVITAQKNLGVMYSEGQGVEKDYVQAYFWFSLAAEQGAEGAISARDDLAEDMSVSQIAEAIRLTHEWQSSRGH